MIIIFSKQEKNQNGGEKKAVLTDNSFSVHGIYIPFKKMIEMIISADQHP